MVATVVVVVVEVPVVVELVPVVVLILASIDVVSGNNVCIFGLMLLNVIFCVAFGPLKDPTVGVEEYGYVAVDPLD